MIPRLVAVAGPLQGRAFSLAGDEVVIGRSPASSLVLADESVSREHCVIRRDGDGHRILDRDSRHGTLLNDLRTIEAPLAHGDRIGIGSTVFAYLCSDEATPVPAPTVAEEPEEESPGAGATATLELSAESDPAEPGHLADLLLAGDRTARELAVLVRLASLADDVQEPEALQQRLLGALLEALPADRVVLLGSEPGRGPTMLASRESAAGATRAMRLTREVVERAMAERVAVACEESLPSVRGASRRWILCAPLLSGHGLLGALWFEASPGEAFDARHLEMATAMARLGAMSLHAARHVAWLRGETQRLREAADLDHGLIGGSLRLRETLRVISRVAPLDVTVLVRGESGTGKELAARAIHRNSARAQRPFVAVNCAALPDSLLESELFGHERGAFTGAVAQKKGRIELAHGGTLFLDEIGELAPGLQAKLLRVLQERELERVGGTRPVHVDVRLIAATHRDLAAAMAKGEFRADLYYRLDVVSLTMPALRDCREDVPLLARHLLDKACRRLGRRQLTLAPETIECLSAHDWPGNVRELGNAMERAVVLATDEVVLPADLPEHVLEHAGGAAADGSYHAAVREAKRAIVLAALERAGGRPAEAARVLRLNPTYLHRLLRNLDLRPPGSNMEG